MSSSSATKRPYEMSARAQAAAKTGERMLEAAMRHFSTRPFEDVRPREIAEEAGVTEQTLYSRFQSKDELLVAAFTWWGLREIGHRDTAPVGDVRAAVKVLFDHYEVFGDGILRIVAQEDRIARLREMTDAGRIYHREWNRRTFAPLLVGLSGARRTRRLSALAVATDLLTWKLLRREMSHTRKDAEAIVVEMIEVSRTHGAQL